MSDLSEKEHLEKVIIERTNSLKDATAFDAEIYSGDLKYSAWYIAISMMGLTILVTKGEMLVGNAKSLAIPFLEYLIPLSITLFFLSLITGAMIKYKINRIQALNRKRMSYLLDQKDYVIANASDLVGSYSSNDELLEKIQFGDYLGQKKNEEIIGIFKKIYINQDKYNKLMIFQQVLSSLSFIILLFLAIYGK
jgi:hypothetical protein